jgi:hypothetical protein
MPAQEPGATVSGEVLLRQFADYRLAAARIGD